MQQIQKNCSRIMARLKEKHIKEIFGGRGRVILASDTYPGVWLEHAYDGLALAAIDPAFSDVALGQLRLFFDNQRPDGQIPYCVLDYTPQNVESYHLQSPTDCIRFKQIQECVSVIRLCNEVAGENRALLEEFYPKCVKWSDWMEKNRVRDGISMAYCAFDTGHDNSARFEGATAANPLGCADKCPENDVVPLSAVDMTAVFYGGLSALGDMAEKLGLSEEAKMHRKKAAFVKKRLFAVCFDENDYFFYDRNKNGEMLPYRTIAVTALFCEHLLTKEEADAVFDRHFRNPEEFATPYPFPAVAVNDPGSRPAHRGNSWSFYSQGLTALRLLRWMDFYGYSRELDKIMEIWLSAWTKSAVPFGQELHPVTGMPSECSPWYTPTMLFYVHAAKRLGYL